MAPDEWERVKLVFDIARRLPKAERESAVRSLCADAPHLVDLILDLLANHLSSTIENPRLYATAATALSCGDVVGGRFKIVRFIAAGGMGEVYEAFDLSLNHRVALKALRLDLLTEPDALVRFRREILISRDVSHESLCRVYDFIEHESEDSYGNVRRVPCLTMELLEGESLASVLESKRPLEIPEALRLLREIGGGLSALHDRGIIHRDLKPSNIVLARRRNDVVRAIVTDFGLAKIDEAERNLFESQANFRAGAPFFMAPETLRTGQVGFASDIYSFGMLIDEMVTRSRAFPARSLPELYYAKLWESPIPPSKRSSSLPEHWERTILRCLEPAPEDRFERVCDILDALEGNIKSTARQSKGLPSTGGTAVALVPERGVEPVPQLAAIPTAQPRASLLRRQAPWAAAAAAVVCGTVVLGVVAYPTRTAAARDPLATTIEVFDITNETRRAEYNHVCSGTTQEVMRRLMNVEGVRVVPLRAARAHAPARTVAPFSLDGALQADDKRTVLSVSLTDNKDGSLVWSERFDSARIGRALDLQENIAENVVAALQRRLAARSSQVQGPAERLTRVAWRVRQVLVGPSDSLLGRPPTRSNAAFDLYTRGRELMEEISPESTTSAVTLFERALQEDPSFALASASLAEAHIGRMNYNAPDPGSIEKARQYADLAVRLDPELAEAHAVLASIQQMQWDWTAAEASYLHALKLKPGYARARRWYAGYIAQNGRFQEAFEHLQRALADEPFDRATPTTQGFLLLMADKAEEAIKVLEETVEGRGALGTRRNLGQAYARAAYLSQGAKRKLYFEKAFIEAQRVAAAEARYQSKTGERPRPSVADEMFAQFHLMAGNAGAAEPYVRRLQRDLDHNLLSPVTMAWVECLRGRNSRALDLLESAANWKDRRLLYLKVSPFLETLRGEPRFKALVNRMRL